MVNTILPAWSERTAHSPSILTCGAGCDEDVLVKLVGAADPDIQGNLGVTLITYAATGTPAKFVYMTEKYLDLVFNHNCGDADDGCGPVGDSRPLLSHEIGHTIGLGHCDIDRTVMCHATARAIPYSEIVDGTLFWTPQSRDVQAILADYP